MNRFLLLIATILQVSAAWTVPNGLKAFGAAATLAAAPMVANAADFKASYADQNHPNCQRIVEVTGKSAKLSGTDGNPGCPPDGSGQSWTLTGKADGINVFVDFSPKGGPKDLKGVIDKTGITWPDGNRWALKN